MVASAHGATGRDDDEDGNEEDVGADDEVEDEVDADGADDDVGDDADADNEVEDDAEVDDNWLAAGSRTDSSCA